MADHTRRSDTDSPDEGPDHGRRSSAPPRAPRWVKVSAIVVGVLLLLAVIVKLTGLGGEHGPGRHFGSSGPISFSVIQHQESGDPALDLGRSLSEGSR